MKEQNLDIDVVAGFGDEWERFDQTRLTDEEREDIWKGYFRLFPWDELPTDAVGLDFGCGSGRWAHLVAPRVGKLLCVDASEKAVAVARRALGEHPNVSVVQADVDSIPLEDSSLDFAYSLGVLHHLPDTAGAISGLAAKLKPGAPLLLYLYYNFENRSRAYRYIWKGAELLRFSISRLPHPARYIASQILAGTVYWPLARAAASVERMGYGVEDWPLAYYRDRSFYVMQTDALDRFGTRLEGRFSRKEIEKMVVDAGLAVPEFSENPPFWVCVSRKSAQTPTRA